MTIAASNAENKLSHAVDSLLKEDPTTWNPKNKTQYPSLNRIATDPRVEEIWDEGDDGLWIALMPGWKWQECVCVHEWSVRDLIRSFKEIYQEHWESVDEAQSILYHVTSTDQIPTIKEKGLLLRMPSNWKVAATGKRYGKGEIYAFDNINDAVRWAAKMDWGLNSKIGSGQISIVKLRRSGNWEIDANDPLGQVGAKGNWLKSEDSVPPKDIIDVVPVTTAITKKLVKDDDVGEIFAENVIEAQVNELYHGTSIDHLPSIIKAQKLEPHAAIPNLMGSTARVSLTVDPSILAWGPKAIALVFNKDDIESQLTEVEYDVDWFKEHLPIASYITGRPLEDLEDEEAIEYMCQDAVDYADEAEWVADELKFNPSNLRRIVVANKALIPQVKALVNVPVVVKDEDVIEALLANIVEEETIVKRLTEPYENLPLECDGLTRVLHTVLAANNVSHKVMLGEVEWNSKYFSPHFWIELPGDKVVDYRLGMWLGQGAPSGIFNPQNEKVSYKGKEANISILSPFLFKMLTNGMDVIEALVNVPVVVKDEDVLLQRRESKMNEVQKRLSTETYQWLRSWVLGDKEKAANAQPSYPSTSVIQELSVFRPKKPVMLYRAHDKSLWLGSEKLQSWTHNKEFVEFLVNELDDGIEREFLTQMFQPSEILVDITLLPEQDRKELLVSGEVIVFLSSNEESVLDAIIEDLLDEGLGDKVRELAQKGLSAAAIAMTLAVPIYAVKLALTSPSKPVPYVSTVGEYEPEPEPTLEPVPEPESAPVVTNQLIKALIDVESGGNDKAVGDKGKALGPLQLHPEYVRDVNRIAGTNYSHKDAFDRDKAIEMFHIYTNYYASPKRLGRQPTVQDVARIHNGGPKGYKKAATNSYWAKVQHMLRTSTPRSTEGLDITSIVDNLLGTVGSGFIRYVFPDEFDTSQAIKKLTKLGLELGLDFKTDEDPGHYIDIHPKLATGDIKDVLKYFRGVEVPV